VVEFVLEVADIGLGPGLTWVCVHRLHSCGTTEWPRSAKRKKRKRTGGRRGDDGNLFSMEEYLARYEGKVQHAIHGHYADAGEDQIYAESPGGPFAPVIVHDTPLFPALIFEGIAAVYGPRTNFAAVWRGCHI
jgi:hypothetical protein